MSASLLRSRRFLPLFLAQSLGALNDNLFKNALVVLVIFSATGGGPAMVAAAGGVFILPYALFSALAGQLADRHDKSRLIRITKLCEVALMGVAAAGFLTGSVALLFAVLFGLGVQATFFGPLKYGILPDHLSEQELVGGNARIEAGTFGGILAGTIAGGALILLPQGAALVSAAGLAVALAGAVAGFAVPRAPAAAPGLRIGWNPWRETAALLAQARAQRGVWLAILGLSWFWMVGATLLTEFPVLARDRFGADGHVVTLLLAMFAIGVGAGSALVAVLLKGEVSARHVPFAALLLSVFIADFAHVCAGVSPATGWTSVSAMLQAPRAWRALADLLLIAMCGGVFSVPLYAILQEWSDPSCRARMIAANNVVNAGFIVAGALAIAVLDALGVSAPGVLAITAALNLVVAGVICRLLPREMLRSVMRWYFIRCHGVTLRGAEHVAAAGARAVIVANHTSFADGCLIAAFLPGHPTFAVNTLVAGKWWARPFLAAVDVFPVDQASPYAARAMVRAVQSGRRLVIFPEGRLTSTGGLMKIYEGAGMVADHAGAVVLPVRIDGLQFTHLSRMRGKLRLRWFPRLTLTILPPQRLPVPAGLVGRPRRRAVGAALQDVMTQAAFATTPTGISLFAALLAAKSRFGASLPIAEDTARAPLSYRRLVQGSVVLGRALSGITAPGERVGLLLPSANATLVSFMALQSIGRVPAMLNFSAGAESMLAACQAAQIGTLLCSRAFAARAKLDPVLARLGQSLRIVWLEDLRAGIGRAARLRGLWASLRPGRLPGAALSPDAPAVVLFTSGSEGTPKGVVLSHRNIVANCAQLAAVVDVSSADRVLNAMPMFHAFGLTGGTLLPLLSGVRSFHYPSPLHYRVVPELAYDTDASIVFGTDTFLAGWARFAHEYDFRAVRYVFSGAERVRPETRRIYMERFGVRILEGYGTTETAPVIAINTAMHARIGTVGRFLPGMEWRLEPVAGIAEGGRMHVRGPNVMRGYLRAERPGVLEPPPDGWHDTGDIVTVDAQGFVTIAGRAKRFAKIAGEMVSMAAAEALAAQLWPAASHAVVATPDVRKGERLVLVTTQSDATPAALLEAARGRGMAEIAVPRIVLPVPALPLLATGKADYPGVQAIAGARAPAASPVD